MGRIRGRDTRPELATRSALHRLGWRFRANVQSLPGKPDIAIKSRRIAIFVHGCFWHLHEGCRLARQPKGNTAYWGPKLRRKERAIDQCAGAHEEVPGGRTAALLILSQRPLSWPTTAAQR